MRVVGSTVLVTLMLALPAPVGAAGHDAKLIEMEKAAWEGWKNADVTPFQQMLAEGVVVILGDGTTMDKAQTLETIGGSGCEVASFELSDFSSRAVGDKTTILTYHARQDAVCEGEKIPENLVVSSVWVEKDGRWWNIHYQETVVHKHPEE